MTGWGGMALLNGLNLSLALGDAQLIASISGASKSALLLQGTGGEPFFPPMRTVRYTC